MSRSRILRERRRWEDVDSFLEDHSQSWEYDEVVRCVLANVSRTDRVVEIGCGCGLVALRVAPEVGHLRGYDLVEVMLEEARQVAAAKGLENVDFRQGDAYGVPEPRGRFDAVVCAYVLDVVSHPHEVLAEARRLLRPGGVLISVTDIFVGESVVKRTLRQMVVTLRGRLRGHVESARPSSEQLRSWHEQAGFRIRDAERWRVIEPLWNECLVCVAPDSTPET